MACPVSALQNGWQSALRRFARARLSSMALPELTLMDTDATLPVAAMDSDTDARPRIPARSSSAG
ncbi:hypothetical protein UB46_25420 [Burkholderiaceae bacterium 16]|nr:hypothetical protein UB46_25420 [Burkholderiaceae bacterium 16]